MSSSHRELTKTYPLSFCLKATATRLNLVTGQKWARFYQMITAVVGIEYEGLNPDGALYPHYQDTGLSALSEGK